jgi:hypothetical protein
MKRLVALIFGAFLAVCTLAATQKNNTAAKALFQARYDGLTRAYDAKDVKAASRYFAEDYSAGDYNHPLDKSKTLDQLRQSNGRFKAISRIVSSVIVNGNKATVIVDTVTQGHIADQSANHLYVIKSQTLDTWIHNSEWQLRHSRVTRNSVTKDGKPVLNRHLGSR